MAAKKRPAKGRLRTSEIALIVAGLLLIVTAVYANVRADAATDRLEALNSVVHDINQRVVSAHIGLLDDLAGRRTMFARERATNMTSAHEQCRAVIADDAALDGTILEPRLDVTRERFAALCDDIARLADLMLLRIAGDERVVADYDVALETFLEESAALPGILREETRSDQTALVRLLGARIVFILLVFAGTALVLRRRVRDQAQLESVHERILDTTDDGIVGISRSHDIRFANPAAGRLLGADASDLVGRSAHAALCGSDAVAQTDHPDYLAVTAVNDTRNAIFARDDGTRIPVELSVAQIDDFDVDLQAVVVFRDVSERQRVEQLRSQFVSMVSHELRTPLTAIHGALGLLRSGHAGEISERAQRMTEIAQTSAERLVRLINDILDLERFGASSAPLMVDEVLLDELVERAVDSLASLELADVHVMIPPIRVRVDPDRVEQLVVNLVGNAVKFSPANTPVRVTVEGSATGDVDLIVTDSGRGIPPEHLDTIFGRFEQVDASDSRELGGTGLGLAICRSIAEQHDGQIWAESNVGVGSRFTFRIPAARVAAVPDRPAAGERHTDLHGSGTKVMLAIRDEDAFVLAQAPFAAAGFEVLRTADMRDLVDAVATARPDAVVVHAQAVDGADSAAIAALRAAPTTGDIPVVLLTFATGRDRTSQADVTHEPVNLAALVQTLVAALDVSQTPQLLLIEDDVELVGVLRAMLEPTAIDVVHVTDGNEAVAWCAAHVPDVISLDLAIPGRDGFAVVDWLRQHNELRRVPLVVYTARDLTDADRDALRLGDTLFLTKSRVPAEEFHRLVLELVTRLTGGGSHEPHGIAD